MTMTRRIHRLLRQGELRPSVRHFLGTGDTARARRENPWLEFSLVSHEDALRAALATEDPAVRAEMLAKIPASDRFFV